MAAGAVVILCEAPKYAPLAAIPVWLAWFYDRADGMLARRQGTVSAWGAWFDANVDELTDMAFQIARCGCVGSAGRGAMAVVPVGRICSGKIPPDVRFDV